MIHNTCPCCGIDKIPHLDGCTFHADAPDDAGDFDEVLALRSEIASLRTGLANLRKGLAEAKNTNLVDYIDALLGDA